MRNLEARILPVGKARGPSTGWAPRSPRAAIKSLIIFSNLL
ncbi:MAG: hypothetical protein ACE5GG_00810 [Candidatus Omnitrophota bacterium]